MDKFTIIDLETTGHDPDKHDKIIEVGMVAVEDNEICDTFSTFLNPEKDIPPFIKNLTGISEQEVKNAPTFNEKADDISNMLVDSYLVAHNVPFDLGFLNAELQMVNKRKLNNPILDTVELARILYPQAPSFKLSEITQYLGINHDDPHRAISDAYVTAQLFLKLKQKLEMMPFETIDGLLKLEPALKSDIRPLLEECHVKLGFRTYDPEDITAFHGLAYKKMPEVEQSTIEMDTSFGDYLDTIYEDGGALQRELSHYEKRDGQREMSEEIFSAFKSGQHALVEAETGTGKSLAYLLPAVYEALSTESRIVISTYTTQLQSQLLDEEIPLIRKLVPFSFRVSLLKGKQHYISLGKFAHEITSGQMENYDVTLTKAMILVWLTETDTGDIEEIQLPSSGYLFFKRVSVDAAGYTDPTSPWFHRSFYQHARKRAQKADIVITNHALLCTDMFNDYQFLPAYDKAIVDEAHHLEETASRNYGLRLDYASINYRLNFIGMSDEPNWLGSLLSRYSVEVNEESLAKWDNIFNQVKYETDEFFRFLFQYVMDQQRKETSFSDIGRTQYRFDNEKENPRKWNAVTEMADRLTFYFRDLIHILIKLEQAIERQIQMNKNDKDDLGTIIESLQRIIDQLEQLFLLQNEENNVKWMEIEAYGAKNAVYLYLEPINMASTLAKDFFDKKHSVVLTSATLTMKQSFEFIKERLGLTEDRLITKKVHSPFSYGRQVQLMIPNDFPDIRENGKEFIYSTCEAILSLAEITKGRMLVLFTSYDMLRKSYKVLKDMMDLTSYMLFAQGISSGSRSRLKKNFIHYNHSVLLGTSSFWEGIDIPGEDLSCLMIVRLPFEPPNHPIVQAKTEHLKQIGKNAFMDLSLPNAVIRFKQGFGRLIRSSSDRGIVFVCDARLIKARYGKYFTDSIPDAPVSFDSTTALIEKSRNWF